MSIETLEYDVIGLGFGPANLAIAVALQEDRRVTEGGLRYCFLEKKPAFEWHGGMLLEDSRMQISFLKDLATLRNPASRFTFINYLHEKRRLESFINISTFTPSRVEYNDYLSWAASHFAEHVHYGEEVVAVEPVIEAGEVQRVRVLSRYADGRTRTRIARNLVIGIGGQPVIPEAFAGLGNDQRIIHSSQYLKSLPTLCPDRQSAYRLAVIGAGQSGAEIYSDLCSRFPEAQVSLIMRGQALRPSDDSPFVNEIFNPAYTDVIYQQPHAVRRELIRNQSFTNYSVVNLDLIEHIYQDLYQQKITGFDRHSLLSNRQIHAVQATPQGIQLSLCDRQDGINEQREFDQVILATGYRRDGHMQLLEGLGDYLADAEVERSYRLDARPGFMPNIFLQGCCEASHGLSDTLLSVLAVRSQEVVDALLLARRRPQAAECA